MAHYNTALCLKHWRSLQTDPRRAPLRAAFDPADLKPLLTRLLMVSSADQDFRFRLSGAFIERLHGFGLKSRPLTDLFHPPFRAALSVALTMAQHRERPLLLSVTAQNEAQDAPLTFDILLMPLRHADGRIDRFVGLYQPVSDLPTPLPVTQTPLLGLLSLHSARLQITSDGLTPAHLRLVSIEGRRVA